MGFLMVDRQGAEWIRRLSRPRMTEDVARNFMGSRDDAAENPKLALPYRGP